MTTSTTEHSNKIKYLIVAVVWIFIWQQLALAIDEEVLFASPLAVAKALIALASTATYWETILFSIVRVLCGFMLGYIWSLILAVLAHKSSYFKVFISPAISVVKATPVASFIILMLMFAGKNFVPVLICILMVTPIVFSNFLTGLSAVDVNLLEMARVYEMTSADKFKFIYWPSLKPYNQAAIGSGLGLCWKAGIAAEVICRTLPSIGNSIWETKYYINTAEMFAWTATVVILSVIFDKIVKKVGK